MTQSKTYVRCTINGEDTEFLCEPRQSLLECLRDVLRVEVNGKTITTIEGMASPEGLHPVQQAFLEEAALQCGICTPGFLIASKALLDTNPNPTEEEIRFWLANNLCRCTGYDKIVRAVVKAGEKIREG